MKQTNTGNAWWPRWIDRNTIVYTYWLDQKEIIFHKDNVHSTMLEARRRKRFIDYGIRGLEWPTRSPDPNFARKSMGHYRAESLHGKELAEALKQKGIDARNYKLFGTRNRIVEIN